ncbi:MAG: peroxiredoxin [Chloroherpetonaceae bacterium]|nr:peroxiredoxin [Chloroherpetonaceae bacterium]
MISIGTKAPDFSLPDSFGKMISLSAFAGKYVLLVFYPGDNTPVCTAQLCGYRENFSAFTEKGIEVLAISTDSVASHEKFSTQYSFPFPLLSDEKREVSRLYDALSFLGISQRAYVLIGKDGFVKFSLSEVLPLFHHNATELLSKISLD